MRKDKAKKYQQQIWWNDYAQGLDRIANMLHVGCGSEEYDLPEHCIQFRVLVNANHKGSAAHGVAQIRDLTFTSLH